MTLKRPLSLRITGFLIAMPIVGWLLSWIMFDDRLYTEWRIWGISFPCILLFGYVSWLGHLKCLDRVRQEFPALTQTTTRILVSMLIFAFVMAFSLLLVLFTYHYFNILTYSISGEDIRLGLILGLSVNLLFITLYEVFYTIDKYKENLAEKELLEQMNVMQEFENLKSQVNPHFLFNCFNTLSSLMFENKAEAEVFLNELSKVYRYLLQTNVEGVATLENEIKFIGSYYRLLKTRHGEAFHMQLEIDKKYHTYLLPSFSLQLLVENAVKHNIASRQHPLKVEIFTTSGNQLVVNNNLQLKLKKESSTSIGLKNIRHKYKLMQQPGFQVVEGDRNFMVVLPLVWDSSKSADKPAFKH
ncbi:MAG TPA: histidine kinase [Flavitalea sp.]|nr:histidine kinase [Flavitalea sp.]